MLSTNTIEWVLKDDQKRNLVLIFPGGGYERCSPREAMPVAKVMNDAGMHAAIFWYRNTKLMYPYVIDEGIEIIKKIKEHQAVDQVILLGFSAGAHYALMLSVKAFELISQTVLGYPVVSSDILIRHEGSLINLLGQLDSPYLREVSLEHQVHAKMKPVFIMHTADDKTVSVQNALVLAKSLTDCHVPFELHIYKKGRHGLSLGTKEVSFEDMDPNVFERECMDVKGWINLSITFMKGVHEHD